MRRAGFLAAVLTAAASGPLCAHPDSAPWGAADPASADTCAACHFGGKAVRESSALQLKGLPQAAAPGGVYELSLSLDLRHAAIAGFMITARMDGKAAGEFEVSSDGVETHDSELRSTKARPASDIIEVRFRWTAPRKLSGDIVFFVAANAGNDDLSPFGDEIHYKEYALPAH